METKAFTTIDRAALGWASGEWDSEPDKVQWPDAETGLPCLAVRNRHAGNWCGYVGVAEGHPLFGRGYSDDGCDFEVHGGLTFAGACSPGEDESKGICHTPSPGEPAHVWWLGFDCAHAWDYSPADVARSVKGYPWTLMEDSFYRPLSYVQSECASLARQVVNAQLPEPSSAASGLPPEALSSDNPET